MAQQDIKSNLNYNLRYGQKALIAYTGIDGCECAEVVELHWLKKMSRKKLKRLAVKSTFPFVSHKIIEYTDVLLNSGTDMYPAWSHIYALESPRLMAKRFGIDFYPDVDVERVNDDLLEM